MSEDYELEEIKAQRKRGFQPKDCFEIVNRSRTYLIIILLITIPTLIVFSYGSYRGSSAIIDIRVDLEDINVIPDRPIQVEVDNSSINHGRLADSTNASFIPFSLSVGILYEKTASIYQYEYYLAQYPDRIISPELQDIVDDLDDSKDFSYASAMILLKNDSLNQIKMRVSSDYSITIKFVILVDFNDPNESDCFITFYYITNHAKEDNQGRAIGSAVYQLENTKTFLLTIDDIFYDYQYINQFFQHTWVFEENIPPYPFVLNGTHQNVFIWNDFWGVK